MGQEDPQKKGMATYSSILTWRIPWPEESGGLRPLGHKESDTTEQLSLPTSKKRTTGVIHLTACQQEDSNDESYLIHLKI